MAGLSDHEHDDVHDYVSAPYRCHCHGGVLRDYILSHGGVLHDYVLRDYVLRDYVLSHGGVIRDYILSHGGILRDYVLVHANNPYHDHDFHSFHLT